MQADFFFLPYLPVVAFILDMVLGDPHFLPHPVRVIGKVILWLEARVRQFESHIPLVKSGFLAVVGLTGIVAVAMYFFSYWQLLGGIFILYFAYAGLALRSLVTEGQKVLSLVEAQNIPAAQHALSLLVSRDTSSMNASEILRALAETVSENFSDGFTAPFFYLTLFGLPGLWAYKTINTFDSMWGYKTKRFIWLGRWAARFDDVLNWFPARFSWVLLLAAGATMSLDVGRGFQMTPKQAPSMESPNAGWPMACCAWLLGGSMGGATPYFGVIKEKPLLGPEKALWTPSMIKTLLNLVLRAGWGAALFTALIVAIWS